MPLDPATATIVSAGIGAGSALLQGDGESSGHQYRRAIKYQPKLVKKNFDAQMSSFAKHGIHPLFGLGQQGYQPPAFSSGLTGQTDASRALAATANLPNDYVNAKNRSELFELEKGKVNAEIALLNAQAARLSQPGNGGVSNDTNEALRAEAERMSRHPKSTIPVVAKPPPGKKRTIETSLFGSLDLNDPGKTPISVLEEIIGESSDLEGAARVVGALYERTAKTGYLHKARMAVTNELERLAKANKQARKRRLLARLEYVLSRADKWSPDVRRRSYK